MTRLKWSRALGQSRGIQVDRASYRCPLAPHPIVENTACVTTLLAEEDELEFAEGVRKLWIGGHGEKIKGVG
jgi:hypothetical protein